MFANPAYTPASASAEALDLPRAAAAPTTRKTSIQAIKAAIMSKAVLIRNPLEAFQRRSASLHVQVAPQEPEVSAQADAAERTIKRCSGMAAAVVVCAGRLHMHLAAYSI